MSACSHFGAESMRHTFVTEQWVGYSREQVFMFFANPANLPPLMPAWQRARVEKAHFVPPSTTRPGLNTSLIAGKGSLISISFRPVPLVPFRLGWDAYIAEFQWNDCFCDEQRKGPFRYFRHCHSIREEIRGAVRGCVVRDEVQYELPLGWVGEVANRLVVNGQMQMLFRHRQKMLAILLPQAVLERG